MTDPIDHQDTVTEPLRTAIASKLLRNLGIALVVYLLLPGPIVFLFNLAGIPWNGPAAKVIQVIFAPLTWLVGHVGAVRDFYDWYGKLFGVR